MISDGISDSATNPLLVDGESQLDSDVQPDSDVVAETTADDSSGDEISVD